MTIQNHSLDVSKATRMVQKQWFAIRMVQKQWFGCFVSPLLGLQLKSWIQSAEFPADLSTKTSLLDYKQQIDPFHDHPKSFIGCIKSNQNGSEAMVWMFCLLIAWIVAQKLDAEY